MGSLCNTTPLLCPVATSVYGNWWLFPSLSLPSFGADPDSITLSGPSGGSSVATQMHTIYSEDIKGAGLIIGTPYGDDLSIVGLNLGQEAIALAENFAAKGEIDSPDNLRDDPVWIFSGAKDTLSPIQNQQAQKDFYDHFGANTKLVEFDVDH